MRRLVSVLLVSVLLLLPSPTSAISQSARRAQTTFALLTNSTRCAPSITHVRIATFRRINPSAPTRAFDGILWDSLLVSSVVCQRTLQSRARQSTYFQPRATSPPGVAPDAAQPFFLEGRDNSPRRCQAFNATFPGTYLFTDDLPTFQARFERDGLLDPGVVDDPVRGDVYMFVVPITNSGEVVGRACAYIEFEDVVPVTPAAEAMDMPACFPGDAVADSPTGGVPMRRLAVGDVVDTPNGAQRVLSFTHRAHGAMARFVRLHAGNASIALTRDHLLRVNGRMTPAGRVVSGDWLDGRAGRVDRVAEVWKRGLYAPVTRGGTMLVQGVVVSCYTSAFPEVVAHALLSPVRGINRAFAWDVCRLVDALRSLWWGSGSAT